MLPLKVSLKPMYTTLVGLTKHIEIIKQHLITVLLLFSLIILIQDCEGEVTVITLP